jgi:hypothetical protein
MATDRKQVKESAKKADRKAEKQSRKAANIAKVEETKAIKNQPVKKVEVAQPVKQEKLKVRDIWHRVELEKKGIVVDVNGEYTFTENKDGSAKTTRKVRSRKHHKKHGYTRIHNVCVVTSNGTHVRVGHAEAALIVANGGKYIAKWQYTGMVNGQHVDWSHKNKGSQSKANT